MYANKFGHIHFFYIFSDYLTVFHVLNISLKHIIFENIFHGDDLEFSHGGIF